MKYISQQFKDYIINYLYQGYKEILTFNFNHNFYAYVEKEIDDSYLWTFKIYSMKINYLFYEIELNTLTLNETIKILNKIKEYSLCKHGKG